MPKLQVVHPQKSPEKLSEFDKDIWDVKILGAHIKPSDKKKLTFLIISQHWLREWAKKCIRYIFPIDSWASCDAKLDAIKTFSKFLAEFYPTCLLENIDENLIVEYLAYLSSKDWSIATRHDRISRLSVCFELSNEMQWGKFPRLHRHQYPRKNRKARPKNIPTEVINQLKENLDELPAPVKRMTQIIRHWSVKTWWRESLSKSAIPPSSQADGITPRP